MTNSINNLNQTPSIQTVGLENCPNEILCRIFSHIDPLVRSPAIHNTCWSFRLLFNDPAAAYQHLENKLGKAVTLGGEEIESYRAAFKERYEKELPHSTLFSKCPRLTALDLSYSDLDSASLGSLLQAAAAYCQIETLHLISCKHLTTADLCLKDFKGLQTLYLTNCSGLAGELDLKGLDMLKILNVNTCKNLTGLLHLNSLGQLQELDLGNCIKLEGELNLRGLHQLKILDARGCRGITGLAYLEELVCLQKLNIRGCTGLARLDLSGLPSTTEVIR